jgi:hypothetical protein
MDESYPVYVMTTKAELRGFRRWLQRLAMYKRRYWRGGGGVAK